MPTEQEIEGLLKALEKSGLDLLKTEDGKTVRNVLEGIDKKMKSLVTLDELKEIFGKENFKKGENGKEKYIGGSTSSAGQKPGETADEWANFFQGKTANKQGWKNSGLDPDTAQLVWDNGWKNPLLIKQGIISSYQGETNLDPTIINKDTLDKALKIWGEIIDPQKTRFKDLPINFKEDEINALVDDQLPTGKKQKDLKDKIEERRKTFFYYLDEPTDGGIDKTKIEKALELTKLKDATNGAGKRDLKSSDGEGLWKPTPKNPITVEILNEVLGLSAPSPDKVVDLKQFFIDKDGYELDPVVVKAGDLLKDCFEKANFDPANPTFCEKEQAANPQKGLLPFPTGAGKTTKVPACLLFEVDSNGNTTGMRNIIIVSPDFPLAQATYDVHTGDWLQTYECEYHRSILGKTIKHGPYKTAFNDLVYWETEEYDKIETGKAPNIKVQWKPKRKYKQGTKGISVLDPSWLDIFLVREKCDINKINCEKQEDKTWIDNGKITAKKKLIPKAETIIMFDEAHFAKNGSTTYHKLQEQAIQLGYNVMKLSATFPGKRFSITLPKGIDRLYMPGLVSKCTIKDSDGKDKEIDLDKIMSESNTLVFLKDAKLTEDQEKILKRENISYSVLDESLEKASTGISFGLRPGSVMFGDDRYSMGFTFNIKLCISEGEISLKKLVSGWQYRRSSQPIPIASLVQQSGRVGRLFNGVFAMVTSRNPSDKLFTKEVDPKDDLASVMVETVLTGSTTELGKTYKSLVKNGVDLLQGAVAIPFPDGKGRYPEEILVGLIQGGINPNIYPKFFNKPSTIAPDQELWDKHMGSYKPKKAKKEDAKELLLLMNSTMLTKKTTDEKGEPKNNFPYSLDMEVDSPLVGQAGFGDQNEAVKAIKEVWYGVVQDDVLNLENKSDEVKFYRSELKSKSQETIKHLAAAFNLLNEEIEVKTVEKLDKNKNKTGEFVLKINCPPKAGKRALVLGAEILTWECEICLTWNSGDNECCRNCGFGRSGAKIVWKSSEIEIKGLEERQKGLEKQLGTEKMEAKIEIPSNK